MELLFPACAVVPFSGARAGAFDPLGPYDDGLDRAAIADGPGRVGVRVECGSGRAPCRTTRACAANDLQAPDAAARRTARIGRNHRRRDVELLVDRKSTRLNSSHSQISYAVFCLKKKTHARPSSR